MLLLFLLFPHDLILNFPLFLPFRHLFQLFLLFLLHLFCLELNWGPVLILGSIIDTYEIYVVFKDVKFGVALNVINGVYGV